MQRYAPWLLAFLVLACAPAPARAQTGGGLYKPFPGAGATPRERVSRYFQGLDQARREPVDALTERQIEAGTFVSGAKRPGAAAASARAAGASGDAPAWPLQLLLLLVPVGAILVARRR